MEYDGPSKMFGIPDIFFLQTKTMQFEEGTMADIAKYDGTKDDEDFIQALRVKAEFQWKTSKWRKTDSCGVDLQIYSAGRAIRCAGSAKPNQLGETPRLLLPCLITNWWALHVSQESLADNTLVPDKCFRREWACAAMLLPADSSCVSIRVPPPVGLDLSREEDDDDDENSGINNDDYYDVWHWRLDISRYPWPETQRSYARREMGNNSQCVAPSSCDKPSIVLFVDNELTLFEKRDVGWYNVNKNVLCDEAATTEIENMKRDALYYILDSRTRHWHASLDRRILALEHMEQSGIACDDNGVVMDYPTLREECEKKKQRSGGLVCICALDDRAIDYLFTGPSVVLHPSFFLADANRRPV